MFEHELGEQATEKLVASPRSFQNCQCERSPRQGLMLEKNLHIRFATQSVVEPAADQHLPAVLHISPPRECAPPNLYRAGACHRCT